MKATIRVEVYELQKHLKYRARELIRSGFTLLDANRISILISGDDKTILFTKETFERNIRGTYPHNVHFYYHPSDLEKQIAASRVIQKYGKVFYYDNMIWPKGGMND